jgi:hypothetical protein
MYEHLGHLIDKYYTSSASQGSAVKINGLHITPSTVLDTLKDRCLEHILRVHGERLANQGSSPRRK